MPYASWLAVLPLAIVAARLGPIGSLSPWLVRIGAVVVISQSTLFAGFDLADRAVRRAAGMAQAKPPAAEVAAACTRISALRPLAALPPGLVAANVDLGPHVVALTPHRVVAAPYHRLDKGILANRAILEAEPAAARGELLALGVDYLALCAGEPDAKPPAGRRAPSTLRARLLAGERMAFLQPIALPAGSPIMAWRVVRRP
jgi:hypothetical protein